MKNNIANVAAVLLSPEPTAAPAPAAKPKKANRYDSLFTGIVIKHSSATTTVYGEDGGRKSKKLADVVLTLRDGCGVITGKIAAVQMPGQKKPRATFGFTASMRGGQALQATEDQAVRDLDAFSKAIEARYMKERAERQAANVDEADEAETILDDLSL